MALLFESLMNHHNLGAGNYRGGPPGRQPGTNPLTAFSAYQPLSGMEQNPLFMAAQATQALTAHLGMQALTAAMEVPPVPPLVQPHVSAAQRSPRSELSGGDSEQSADGDTDDDQHRRPPPPEAASGVAGMKIPVTCNDVRGLVYLDQQVVGCYCPTCEARVASGHDRPLFSFTRFERHCGSKAKKWRLSLRIEPGTVKECPPGDGPMPLGQWMEMRGLMSWGARSSVKIGLRESDDDDGAGGPLDGNYLRRAAVGPISDRRAAGALAVLAGATSVMAGAKEREAPGNAGRTGGSAGGSAGRLLPLKREREEYDTPDLPQQADRGAWLAEQRRRFEAEQAAAAAAAAAGEGGGQAGSSSGVVGIGSQAGKHAAIFKLVYGMLEGQDRRAFNEDYLPWLNELPAARLDQEFNTLLQYLELLQDMPWQAVQGLMRAYLKAILARVQPK